MQSLCNWMESYKPLDEAESTFLNDWDDMRSPSDPEDKGGLNRLLEKSALGLKHRGYDKVAP
jgi:hypothetical protein